jgi:hypothetical protein
MYQVFKETNMHIARIKNKISFMLALASLFAAASVWQACSSEDETVGKPIISGFTPSDGGPIGTVVKINGQFFSTLTTNKVMFNGVEAEVISATSSSILARVPEGASTGEITVSVDGREGSSASAFAVTGGTPTPYITSFTPSTGNGADMQTITISGYNFSPTAANNTVSFGDVEAATPSEASATSLKVTVPAGARTGKIKVEVNGVTGTSDTDFSVATPTVTAFTPDNSIVGGTVIITGTNFSKTKANNVVRFNGVQAAAPTEASETSLTVKIPAGATTGTVSVSVDGLTGTSEKTFTVN